MDRRTFFTDLSICAVAYNSIVNKLRSISNYIPSDITKELAVKRIVESDTFIVDLHCHPNFKHYLWGSKMWKHHPNKKGENRFNMQVDIHKLAKGNVRGFLAAHYLPERGLKEQANTIKKLFPKIKFFAPVFASKIENGDDSNFRQLEIMMDDFEHHLEVTNKKTKKIKLLLARSYTEFEKIINEGNIAVAHAIEGSHSLGRNLCESPRYYINNIRRLHERGVCLITLAHFFPNDLSYPVEGMPPHSKKELKLYWKYNPEIDDKPLTGLGKQIVEEMLKLGIIVDLTHLTPSARAEVFRINKHYKRPVIFTHTGVQEFFNGPPEFQDFRFMGVTPDEIKQIKSCRGVIGIVFMNYWLIGNDTHTHIGRKEQYKNGIKYIIETIRYIRREAGGYENIALGSDFDGFADSPADLKNASFFPHLLSEIKKELGLDDTELAMIAHGNAMRVLKEGWR